VSSFGSDSSLDPVAASEPRLQGGNPKQSDDDGLQVESDSSGVRSACLVVTLITPPHTGIAQCRPKNCDLDRYV